MPKILKFGKVVGNFVYDQDSHKFILQTNDSVVKNLSESVQGIKGKYISEQAAMISYFTELRPGDPDYAFQFLSQLLEIGYEVGE